VLPLRPPTCAFSGARRSVREGAQIQLGRSMWRCDHTLSPRPTCAGRLRATVIRASCGSWWLCGLSPGPRPYRSAGRITTLRTPRPAAPSTLRSTSTLPRRRRSTAYPLGSRRPPDRRQVVADPAARLCCRGACARPRSVAFLAAFHVAPIPSRSPLTCDDTKGRRFSTPK
jgi:hypothetical protein